MHPLLRRITLGAPDPGALLPFYASTLSLPASYDPRTNTLTIRAGGSELRFIPAAPGSQPVHHFAFDVPRNLIDAAQSWLAARTPLIPNRDTGSPRARFPSWNAEAVYFHDPAGNIGELIARHDLPNDRPAPFSPEHILHLSEIGLPVRNVTAAAERLMRAFDLPCYPDPSAPVSPDFTALGDERGLLILVPESRPWAPAYDRPARITPIEAELATPSRGRNATTLEDGAYRLVSTPS